MAEFLAAGMERLMSMIFNNHSAPNCSWMIMFLALGLILHGAPKASAQDTRVYSFEPDLEGFHFNGGGLTVSQETSGIGATHGANSMKLEFADFSSFAGAETENIPAAFL